MATTMLFVPGNNPAMVQNAGLLGADAIIFDLEDAVSSDEKDAARMLVRNALKNVDYCNCERTVRVNAVDYPEWERDITEIVKGAPDGIVIPKAQNAGTVKTIIEAMEKEERVQKPIGIIPLIETAEGVERVFEILSCSPRITAVIFGAEDYTADIGAERSKEGSEILYARCRILNAAVAAGVDAIDTPFTDVEDLEGLKQDVLYAKKLGFKGKTLISPRHCKLVKELLAPTEGEISYAFRVIEAIRRARAEGKGVISLDGKMIDAPIVARAKKVLELAGVEGGGYE